MRFDRPTRVALAGALGCLLLLVTVTIVGGAAWRAWLGAAALAASLPVGSVGLLLVMRFLPGGWARELGAPLEATALLTPVAGVLVIPVILAAGEIYPWVAAPAGEGFRAIYLSTLPFAVRTLAWFALLAWAAWRPPAALSPTAGALALVAFPTLGTLIAVDWLLSLDPDFASSGFGLYLLCIQMLSALAAAIMAAAWARSISRPGLVGGVLLTLLLLWAYFAFMQLFITWSGDLPPGVAWYQARGHGGWKFIEWTFAAMRLAPAVLLLFGPLRRDVRVLAGLSCAVLAGSVLEIAWLALPGPSSSAGALDVLLYALTVTATGTMGVGLAPSARRWRERRQP